MQVFLDVPILILLVAQAKLFLERIEKLLFLAVNFRILDFDDMGIVFGLQKLPIGSQLELLGIIGEQAQLCLLQK